LSFYIDPSLRSRFDPLPEDLKEALISRGRRLETLHDLTGALEEIASRSRERGKYLPNLSSVSSARECTGLIPAMPDELDEYENYQDLCGMEVSKEKAEQ